MKLNFKPDTYRALIDEANKRKMPVASMIACILDHYTNNLIKEENNEPKEKQPQHI